MSAPTDPTPADPPPSGDAPDTPRPGTLLGGRWLVEREIGAGGVGHVFEATDQITSQRVAVKCLRTADGSARDRVHREVAALRLLRLPGVVRFLDDGGDTGFRYVVMEYVEGAPFPGRAVPARWEDIAATTLAFLEAIARIHAAGVVHRDLKPSNVLVDAQGRPTVVDFGISWGPVLGPRLTVSGAVVGTPIYLAPEQVVGRPADARTDLYSVGVMLYEALAGRLPHESTALDTLLQAKLHQLPPPLVRVAPDVPDDVLRTVDALLSIDPALRPSSAGEAARGLFGGDPARTWGRTLPRVGTDAPVRALVEAARERRPLDVVGRRGSGRTRTLEDAAAAVRAADGDVARTAPGSRPFESLERVTGADAAAGASTLAEASAAHEARLRTRLRAGAVLVVDDPETVDRWSAAVLARCRGDGCTWRALAAEDGPCVRLEPLSRDDLRALFAGPDRVFHLREDGATVLWERTGGLPARVAAVVAAWIRAGVAREDGGLVALSRESLHRLRGGMLAVDAQTSFPVVPATRTPECDEVLAWVILASPEASVRTVAAASGLPAWRVDAAVGELETEGSVARLPDGRLVALGASAGLPAWTPDRRAAAERALAAATPGLTLVRFRHVLGSGDAWAVADEAIPLARHLVKQGQTADALAVLAEALAATRIGGRPDREAAVVREHAKASLAEGTAVAVDRSLYEVSRCSRAHPQLEPVVALLSTTRRAGGADPADVLRDLETLGAFDDEDLELWRRAQMARAATRLEPSRAADVIESIRRWADGSGSARAAAAAASWRAHHLLAQSRFEEAARLFVESVAGSDRLPSRLNGQVNAALAWIEAGRLEEALAAAGTALALATERRHVVYAARAETLLRMIRYRMARTPAVDEELLDALDEFAPDPIVSLAWLTESAVAWRAGDRARALTLAAEAGPRARAAGLGDGEVLARCFASYLAGGAAAEPTEALVAAVGGVEANDLAAQGWALVAGVAARRGEPLPAGCADAAARLTGHPAETRMDLLSPAEVDSLAAGRRIEDRREEP